MIMKGYFYMENKKTIVTTALSALLAFSTTFTTIEPAQAFPGSTLVGAVVHLTNQENNRDRGRRVMRQAMEECIRIFAARQWQYKYHRTRRCKPNRVNRQTCDIAGGMVMRITSRQRLRNEGSRVRYRVNWSVITRCEDSQGDCATSAASGQCGRALTVGRGARGSIEILQQRRYERATFG